MMGPGPDTGIRPVTPSYARFFMTQAARLVVVSALLGTLCSCAELRHAPWSEIGAGTHTVGGSSGWAWDEAEVTLVDNSGTPDLGTGTDSTDLAPISGGALKYNYFVTDNFALGLIFEFRTFDPDPVAPLESEIDADEYTSTHYLLSTRYWSDPWGDDLRWKWFGGLDLNYSPGVSLDATVTYAPGFVERVGLSGDQFFTLNPTIGLSYLVRDNVSFEFGTFYEFPIDSSDDTLTLNIPDGFGATNPNEIDGSLEPEGIFIFAGLTYYF